MTNATKRARRLAPLPATTVAAFLLAGCSTGHIGETWQCPLAEGGSCDSVAAADPAVPDPAAARGMVLQQPLWLARETGQPGAPASAAPCEAECGGGFDPIAWLVGLFGGDGDGGEGRAPGPVAGAGVGAEGKPGPATAAAAPEAPPPAASKQDDRTREPKTGARPAPGSGAGQAPGPSQDEPAQVAPGAGDLRTGEVVARIWIAPFVDAGGVYREGSWVRVVLEPAGWRLPR